MADLTNLQQLLIFTIIEVSIFIGGIVLVWVQQRKQTALIEKIILDPEYAAAVANNMIWGFLDGLDATGKTGKALEVVKLRQSQFFGFIHLCGQTAFGAVAEKAKIPKKLQGAISFVQTFSEMLGIDLKGIAGKSAEKVAETTVSGLRPLG